MISKIASLEYGKLYERPAAEELAKILWSGAVLVEGQTFAHVDFSVVLNQRWVAMLEVKKRTVASNKYPTTAVNFDKHNAALAAQKYFKVPTLCLVVFTDRAGYFDLHSVPDGQAQMGRGEGTSHALYKLDRFTWVDGLSEAIEQRVAVTQQLQTSL